MALDTLLRLQAAENARPMQEVENLGKTLSGMIQSRGETSLEQDALNVFGDGNVGMDRINTLREMHPNAPLQKIFTLASNISTQSKAQKMKNLGKTVLSAYTTARNEDRQLGPDDFKAMAEESGVAVQDIFKVMGELVPWVKKTYEERKKENDLYEVDYMGNRKLVEKGEKAPTRPGGLYVGKKDVRPGVGGKKTLFTITSFDNDGNPVFDEGVDVTGPGSSDDQAIKDLMDKDKLSRPEAIAKLADLKREPNTVQVFKKVNGEWESKRISSVDAAKEKANGWDTNRPLFKKGEPDKSDKPEKAPSGYKFKADGTLTFIPGGPADPGTKGIASPERLKRLSDFVAIATGNGKEPSPNDVILIQDMAEQMGYEFKKTNVGKTAVYGVPGTSLLDIGGKETGEWRLLPKATSSEPTQAPVVPKGTTTKKLIGTKDGKPVYDLGNDKWQIGD